MICTRRIPVYQFAILSDFNTNHLTLQYYVTIHSVYHAVKKPEHLFKNIPPEIANTT